MTVLFVTCDSLFIKNRITFLKISLISPVVAAIACGVLAFDVEHKDLRRAFFVEALFMLIVGVLLLIQFKGRVWISS